MSALSLSFPPSFPLSLSLFPSLSLSQKFALEYSLLHNLQQTGDNHRFSQFWKQTSMFRQWRRCWTAQWIHWQMDNTLTLGVSVCGISTKQLYPKWSLVWKSTNSNRLDRHKLSRGITTSITNTKYTMTYLSLNNVFWKIYRFIWCPKISNAWNFMNLTDCF